MLQKLSRKYINPLKGKRRHKVLESPTFLTLNPFISHSKFKQKLTSVHRRSAFCIFHPINSSAKSTDTKSSAPTNFGRSKAQRREIGVDAADDSSKTTKTTITCNKINNNNNNNTNRRKRGTKLQQQENVIDECTTSKRTKPSTAVASVPKKGNLREKIRQQEKEDFKLAKMLQEYDDNAHSPSSNRTMRYALRSRSKPSSSLSSSSSSIENIQNKFALMTTTKSTKKNCTFTSELGKPLRNGTNKTSILSFTDQKLTRSKRLAMAITGA